jgi:hypothetical protein
LDEFLDVVAVGIKISRDLRRGARCQTAKEIVGCAQAIEIGGAKLSRAVLRRGQQFFHRLRQPRGLVEPHDASSASKGVCGAGERFHMVPRRGRYARETFLQNEGVGLQFRVEQVE